MHFVIHSVLQVVLLKIDWESLLMQTFGLGYLAISSSLSVCGYPLEHENQIKQVVLERIPASSRSHRLLAKGLVVVIGHDDDLGGRVGHLDSLGGFDAVYMLHPDVHQHQVRSLRVVR